MPIEALTLVRLAAKTPRNLTATAPVLLLLCGVRGGVRPADLSRAGAADTGQVMKKQQSLPYLHSPFIRREQGGEKQFLQSFPAWQNPLR